MEVKSTTKHYRIHRFSIEQLNPNIGSELIIASVFVIETGVGKSILNLRDEIVSKVKDIDLNLRLNEIIYKTIGSDYEKLGDVFFDYQLAKDSLCFYNSEVIPKILNQNIPSEISNVSFDCDLTNVSPLLLGEKKISKNPLFLNLGL